jgi:hypothetical protein
MVRIVVAETTIPRPVEDGNRCQFRSHCTSLARPSIHNILSELAGLYGGLDRLPRHVTATVVHDYAGVGAWIVGSYKKTQHPITKSVVTACRARIADLGLEQNFIHQRGHQKTRVVRDDFAKWKALPRGEGHPPLRRPRSLS